MPDPEPRPEPRIGTREREIAMGALDEHMRAGRLDAVEYAERSATASTARVRSELDALFADLPEPHPVYPGDREAPAAAAGAPAPAGGTRVDDEPPPLVAPIGATLGRHAGKLGTLVPVIALGLFALSGFRLPQIFLLVPVALVVLGYLGNKYGG